MLDWGADAIGDKIEAFKKGKSDVLESGHSLILGTPPRPVTFAHYLPCILMPRLVVLYVLHQQVQNKLSNLQTCTCRDPASGSGCIWGRGKIPMHEPPDAILLTSDASQGLLISYVA